jgi:predicted glycoside hydrolase/deacetylase ChbG (UPF0249 family)
LNADDLGYEPEVTRGLLRAMTEGVVSSATMVVNGPYSAAAAAPAQGFAVGLHLNLARWKPLSAVPEVLLSRTGELVEARAGELPSEVVEREVHAQLDALHGFLGKPATHIDVHKHLHRSARVLRGLLAAARARGLPVRSIDEGMRAEARAAGVKTNDHFLGDAGATGYWTLAQLEQTLGALPADGVVELMCHPGYAPKAIASGYSAQREVELETFTSSEAKALLKKYSVRLESWAGL